MLQKIGNRLLAVGRTDVGNVRTLNEDNFRIDPEVGLLIVSDGMGGHEAGELASLHVVDTIDAFFSAHGGTPLEELETEENDNSDQTVDLGDDATLDSLPNPVLAAVASAVTAANTKLNALNEAQGYSEGHGMGATVVGLWMPSFTDTPVVFHVGDSRMYLFSGGELKQVTQDHSMYQFWVNSGRMGVPPAKNVLLQAMGPGRRVIPDVNFQPVAPGDVVVLCTDGLTGMANDEMIAEVLRGVDADSLAQRCDRLVELAKERGGKDNVTVILGYVQS
ncbi:MAG: serine/threonine-protein phosphatase [Magnetococcales bacterium]|nr:serine/threonine-protein phosphatase [Magnetococcales bacterium]